MPRARLRVRRRWTVAYLLEVWRHRDLLWQLAGRDIRIRYKQTILGTLWVILQPLLTMIIFTLLFGRLGGFDRKLSGNIPYSLYTLAALVPWQVFAAGLINAGNSLVLNQNLITKVYFPRVIVPMANVLATILDFIVSLALLVLLIIGYRLYGIRVPLTAGILLVPLFSIAVYIVALAAGLWLAALNVEYRDVRHAIPFLAQIWMYVTPVAYPSQLIRDRSETLYLLYSLNPMSGLVDGFRWAFFGEPQRIGTGLAISAAVTVVILFTGALYFRSMERRFADVI